MGCTIYAASPKALPADEAPGQDRYYPLAQYRHLHGNCSQRIAARWVRGFTRGGEWVAEAGESATWSEALTTTQLFVNIFLKTSYHYELHHLVMVLR